MRNRMNIVFMLLSGSVGSSSQSVKKYLNQRVDIQYFTTNRFDHGT